MTLRIGEPHIPSRCGADFPNGCVEVTQASPDLFIVRDSNRSDPIQRGTTRWLAFDAAEWGAFVSAVKAGEYDPSA